MPGPILFGIVAFLVRFVPYVGPVIAAAFPVALAAAVDPGWAMALKTLALFIVVEGVLGNVVEPLLYGRNTGLSPIAVIVAATFWTWLWGPVGLLLSTPLTVCLVVIGRHVDQLNFLDVILGDAPALSPVEHFYQRLLVGDAAEVADQAEEFLKAKTLVAYYDEVALSGLLMAQDDLARGVLDEARQKQIAATIDEMIDDLSDHVDEEPPPVESGPPQAYGDLGDAAAAPVRAEPPPDVAPPAQPSRKPVLCIAGRTAIDEAAGRLLAQILEKHGMTAKIEPAEMLSVGGILHLPGAGDQSSASPTSGATCGRRAFVTRSAVCAGAFLADARIIAGFWRSDAAAAAELCTQTRADACVTQIAEAVDYCVAEAKAAEALKADVATPPRPDPAARLAALSGAA